jgi:hypothetical protein
MPASSDGWLPINPERPEPLGRRRFPTRGFSPILPSFAYCQNITIPKIGSRLTDIPPGFPRLGSELASFGSISCRNPLGKPSSSLEVGWKNGKVARAKGWTMGGLAACGCWQTRAYSDPQRFQKSGQELAKVWRWALRDSFWLRDLCLAIRFARCILPPTVRLVWG